MKRRALLLSVAVSLVAGCSSGDPSSELQGSTSDPIDAYLRTIYAPESVRHSFQSKLAESIDCVAFEEEPGVRALLARGGSLEQIRAELAQGRANAPAGASKGDVYFAGDPDDAGHARACPEGTVAHVRLTRERIAAAGGLDAFVRSRRKQAPPMNPTPGGYKATAGNYAWVHADYTATNQGGTSTMTIAAPSLPASVLTYDHSIAQVWVSAGGTNGQPIQTVEAGWTATPCGQAGPCWPRLFIYSTADSYADGCYNGGSPADGCVTWIPNTGASLAPDALLTPSKPGGVQHELTITVRHGQVANCSFGFPCIFFYTRWDVYAGIDGGEQAYLGAYMDSAYNGGPLTQSAAWFKVGGEVEDTSGASNEPSPPRVTMGEGTIFDGFSKYGSTAYHRDFGYYSPSFSLVRDGATVYYTAPSYVYDVTSAAGSPSWNNWFYFGDAVWLYPIFL